MAQMRLVDFAPPAVTAACAPAFAAANSAEQFVCGPADVAALVATVRLLNKNLDSWLQFNAAAK
jgi:hypothetical protein